MSFNKKFTRGRRDRRMPRLSLRDLREDASRGILPSPSNLLASMQLSSGDREEIRETLLSLARLARRTRDERWLREVEREAMDLQFMTDRWIQENIQSISSTVERREQQQQRRPQQQQQQQHRPHRVEAPRQKGNKDQPQRRARTPPRSPTPPRQGTRPQSRSPKRDDSYTTDRRSRTSYRREEGIKSSSAHRHRSYTHHPPMSSREAYETAEQDTAPMVSSPINTTMVGSPIFTSAQDISLYPQDHEMTEEPYQEVLGIPTGRQSLLDLGLSPEQVSNVTVPPPRGRTSLEPVDISPVKAPLVAAASASTTSTILKRKAPWRSRGGAYRNWNRNHSSGASLPKKVKPSWSSSLPSTGKNKNYRGKGQVRGSTAGASASTSTPASESSQCPLSACFGQYLHRKKHAFSQHLPAIFDDQTNPQRVTAQRIDALRWLVARVYRPGATLDEFVTWIMSLGIIQRIPDIQITEPQRKAMQHMAVELNLGPLPRLTVNPICSPVVLIHWKVLMNILSLLSYMDRLQFLDRYPVATRTPASAPKTQPSSASTNANRPPDAFDSHYHHDRLCEYLGKSQSTSLEEVCREVQPTPRHQVTVVGAVANFCDPHRYPSRQDVARLRAQGVRVTVGVHPKKARISDAQYRNFVELARNPDVAGLGEIGLDNSSPEDYASAQKVTALRVLEHLRPHHTLVLHCRETKGKDPAELYDQLRMILQLAGVPTEQRIHVHCFNGTVATLEAWVAHYPKTWFGFTTLVDTFNDTQREAIGFVDKRYLLLETDAPYFAYPKLGVSAPSTVGHVADIVARIRNCTWGELLQCCTRNAQEAYPQ